MDQSKINTGLLVCVILLLLYIIKLELEEKFMQPPSYTPLPLSSLAPIPKKKSKFDSGGPIPTGKTVPIATGIGPHDNGFVEYDSAGNSSGTPIYAPSQPHVYVAEPPPTYIPVVQPTTAPKKKPLITTVIASMFKK